jgi:4-hydroxybenzoate polyprenyltransferase/phosphoserine phosphatase
MAVATSLQALPLALTNARGNDFRLQTSPESNELRPLCVDLDGTLLSSDSLLESICQLLRRAPWTLALLPFWASGGRASLKREIARRTEPDVDSWPWNPEVLALVKGARREGRKVTLATGADRRIAEAVQARLQLFDEILASDGRVNLSGPAKAAALVQLHGKKKFDYVGDQPVDVPVWQCAHRAYLVGGRNGLAQRVEAVTTVERVLPTPAITIRDWARALRVHQWSKNLLLLIPLIGAHKWAEPARLCQTLLGVAAFSICASSVYLLNDLLDLEADRHHPSKRNRPFASGRIPLLAGLVLAPALLAISSGIALLAGWKFAAVFATYYALTLFYSLRLKQIELVDVLTLASLYGIRVLAGGVAAAVTVSDWLVTYSLFVFLSLAFVKRFTELRRVRQAGDSRLQGRGYAGSDADLIGVMGIASGYVSVLVMAMYINHPSVTSLYRHPQVLWLACPLLLYWISRIWLLAARDLVHDDPILFTLRDRPSWLVAILLALVGFAADPQ